MAMINLAGLFFPLPPFLNSTKAIWPAYHLHELGLIAAGVSGQHGALAHLFALIAATTVFSGLAAWRLTRVG
jgi:hypothetical protein